MKHYLIELILINNLKLTQPPNLKFEAYGIYELEENIGLNMYTKFYLIISF